jgi:hypothetical protein
MKQVSIGLEREDTPGLCRFPTLPQEQIRHLARLAPQVNEEEFVLETDPSNREPRTLLVRKIALRGLFRQGPLPPGGTVDVWGICEHLYLGPFISSPLTQYRQHAGRIAIDLRM